MKGTILVLSLFALLVIGTANATTIPPPTDICIENVYYMPASCVGGEISTDTWDTCRTLVCTNGSNSLTVLACDKPSQFGPTYFEMYKQGETGTQQLKLCLGTSCISDNGFARSPNFPICPDVPVCTPSNGGVEICDQKDNDCDGQTDEGGVCTPVCVPTNETCNQRDDDCDGQIDENNVCAPATCTVNHRTQTQGGWGTKASGNNPGTYRDANFATAFPSGLTVGSTYTIKLMSSSAVQNFLPQGGTAAAISQNYVNPTSKINVLAGQVVALTLSVGFDNADPNFSPSNTPLASLKIKSGACAGMTVQQVLNEANKALGGSASSLTPAKANECVTNINENFVDGGNKGKLACA